MKDPRDPQATAHALISAAFDIYPWTTIDELQENHPRLRYLEQGAVWMTRVPWGRKDDLVYLAVNFRSGRIETLEAYARCKGTQTLTSTEATISDQMNIRLGKGKRVETNSRLKRKRAWRPGDDERVTLCRDQRYIGGVLITEFVIQREFEQPRAAERPNRPIRLY